MMIKSNEKINNLDVYFKINYYDSSNYYQFELEYNIEFELEQEIKFELYLYINILLMKMIYHIFLFMKVVLILLKNSDKKNI